tara:strand:- start:808 stop:1809 length:1002 start_codon:yes stop_codon:yes gene_type:complete
MKKILLSFTITPLVYLVISSLLVLVPVNRNYPAESLDFNVLSFTDTSDVTVEKLNFTARDGNELFYRRIQGDTDIVVVLLHGSGTEGRYLVSLAEKLYSSLNITVVIPDLRGHGESALSNMGDISYLDQFSHDLEDLNGYLRLHHPNAKIILGGHSSGGGLAVKYGGNGLTKFDGYILLAPYLGYQAPTVRPNSGGWVQVSTRRYIGLSMLNNVGISGLNGFPVLFFNRPAGKAYSMQADSYSYRLNESFSPQSYTDDLQANKKPMLALIGKDDEAFYSDKFEAVFRENAPHTELIIIPDTKHLDLPSGQVTANFIAGWLEKSYNKALQRTSR